MNLSRQLCDIADELEGRWIAIIEELDAQGQCYGDPEYDKASANLCAVANEFYIGNEE